MSQRTRQNGRRRHDPDVIAYRLMATVASLAGAATALRNDLLWSTGQRWLAFAIGLVTFLVLWFCATALTRLRSIEERLDREQSEFPERSPSSRSIGVVPDLERRPFRD